jgi:hypothetical protein
MSQPDDQFIICENPVLACGAVTVMLPCPRAHCNVEAGLQPFAPWGVVCLAFDADRATRTLLILSYRCATPRFLIIKLKGGQDGWCCWRHCDITRWKPTARIPSRLSRAARSIPVLTYQGEPSSSISTPVAGVETNALPGTN